MAEVRRGGKKGRKIGRQARSPAQARYWQTRWLEKRKVANLVRCCGMEPNAALIFWRDVRKTRHKLAFLGTRETK